MVKLALINPGIAKEHAVHEPLHLGFLASYLLKEDVKVKIIDQLAGQNVEKEIKKFKPDIVGITATSPVIGEAYQIADTCKNMGILTIIGGVHVSVLSEEALKHADIVVKGEGERAMLKIIAEHITKGIVQCRPIKDLSEIPHPARHLMDMDFYAKTRDRFIGTHLHFVKPSTKTCAIISQRGCPNSCIFCHNSWKGVPMRFHSAEFVVEEMKQVMEDYKIRAIFFMDDDFLANKPRMLEICELIKKEKIDVPWGCQTRVSGLNMGFLKKIKDAGCKQLTFGLESGSQKILSILKNNVSTIGENKKAIQLCKQSGMLACGSFMIGSPKETVNDIHMTQKFILESGLDGVGVHMTTAFPGTKLWQIAEEQNLIPNPVSWKDFTTGKFTLNFTDNIANEELKKLYQETIDIAFRINNFGSTKALFKTAMRNPVQSLKTLLKSPKKTACTILRSFQVSE